MDYTTETFKRITPDYLKIGKKFIDLGTYVVDHECNDMSGKPIIGEERDILIKEKAYDMETGSNFTKKNYLGLGALCGFGISAILFAVLKN